MLPPLLAVAASLSAYSLPLWRMSFGPVTLLSYPASLLIAADTPQPFTAIFQTPPSIAFTSPSLVRKWRGWSPAGRCLSGYAPHRLHCMLLAPWEVQRTTRPPNSFSFDISTAGQTLLVNEEIGIRQSPFCRQVYTSISLFIIRVDGGTHGV
jgi:hypothetical protein